MCREREREREGELCILNRDVEPIGRATIPADHEESEVGRREGGCPRKKVEAVGEQNCRFPAKTASGVKSRTYLHLCCCVGKGVCVTHGEEKRGGLLVIGETPNEAADDVADPKHCLDQHRLEVILAHPVVL